MHHHHHHHHHHPDDQQSAKSRFGWAFFLNLGFTVIEFIGGLLTNSTAILADAVHDLGDSLSLGFAWLLAHLSERPASETFSYGYRRFSLLGSLLNGVILLGGALWVLNEAIARLAHPEMPQTEGMLVLALLGIAVNGFAAYKLSGGKTLNEKVLNWHLIEDVLGWVAVLILALVLTFVEWPILDPLLSIGFTLFILFNVGKLLWQTAQIFLQAVPNQALERGVREKLQASQAFCNFHHLHIWSLDGEHHVLTVHIVLERDLDLAATQALKREFARLLAEFSISHTTVEFEFADEQCRIVKP